MTQVQGWKQIKPDVKVELMQVLNGAFYKWTMIQNSP